MDGIGSDNGVVPYIWQAIMQPFMTEITEIMLKSWVTIY